MKNELQFGDIVQLNSGGPESRVVSGINGNVTVEWQGSEGPSRAVFPIPCVRRVEPRKSPA
jgi:uncharacterized protein YodC (DUF2158 family)